MKNKNQRNKEEFVKVVGVIMAGVGFISASASLFFGKMSAQLGVARTNLNGVEQASNSVFENSMSWEQIFALMMSIALVVAGLIIFFASARISNSN